MRKSKQQSQVRWMTLLLSVCIILWLIASRAISASQTAPIKMYLYHQQPPFVTGDVNYPESGLTFDLAELLMQQQDAPQIKVEVRPRKRLDRELKNWVNGDCPENAPPCDSNWMLFGVIPEWGWESKNEHTFSWIPLFKDADLLVSSKQNPVYYEQPSSLTGLVFAGLHGHHYPGVLGKMIENGQLVRDDGSNNFAVLQRVLKGRADITLIRQSTLNYLVRHNSDKLTNKLYVSEPAYNSFTLQMMLPHNRPDVRQWLKSALNSCSWQTILRKYDLSP